MHANYSRRLFLGASGVALVGGLLTVAGSGAMAASTYQVQRTPAEWRRRLGPDRYSILREAGTERPFTSPLNKEKRRGTFACAGCALPLFSSATKYDGGAGGRSGRGGRGSNAQGGGLFSSVALVVDSGNTYTANVVTAGAGGVARPGGTGGTAFSGSLPGLGGTGGHDGSGASQQPDGADGSPGAAGVAGATGPSNGVGAAGVPAFPDHN